MISDGTALVAAGGAEAAGGVVGTDVTSGAADVVSAAPAGAAVVVAVGAALVGVVVCWAGVAVSDVAELDVEDGADDVVLELDPDGEVLAVAGVVDVADVVGVAEVEVVGVADVLESLGEVVLDVLVDGATAGTNSAADGGTV